MTISDRSVLCAYHYDPLDRLADCSPAGQGSARFFYQKSRLATHIQGQIQYTLLRTDEHLLAQQRMENNQSDCALLATDQQQSVIAAQGLAFAYTPYGHHFPSAGPMDLPGFTGQRVDPVTGHYLLGNGYRAFNPVLMRFNSPDSLSPFGEGGLNAYAYCGGDPVNWSDSTGHVGARVLAAVFKELASIARNRNITPNMQNISAYRNSVLKLKTSTPSSLMLDDSSSVPKFIKRLPQPQNVPYKLRTVKRLLPDIPSAGRLHTQWDDSILRIRPHNIYHLPAGMQRFPKHVELPASRFQRVLTDDLPLNTIYENSTDPRSYAKALSVIRRGEELERSRLSGFPL